MASVVMKKILKLYINLIDRFNGVMGFICSILTIFMVLNVFVVVALRYGFSVGRIWMQELYVWTHAFVFLAASGYTLRDNGHVRIDLIYGTRSSRTKAIVNLVGSFLFALPFLGFLWKWSFPMVVRSFENLEKSSEAGGLPALYILKGAILVFCITVGLQVSALIVRCLLTLFTDENYFPEEGHGAKASAEPIQLGSETV